MCPKRTKTRCFIFLGILAVILIAICVAIPLIVTKLRRKHFRVIHVNDFRSLYEGVMYDCGDVILETENCSCSRNKKCLGGIARMHKYIQQIRDIPKERLIVVNTGNNIGNTTFFRKYGTNMTSHFIKLLKYDAITLGRKDVRHKDVIKLLKQLQQHTPVIFTNSLDPNITGLVKKSIVIEFEQSVKVGVLGVFNFNKTVSSDEIKAISKEADRLIDEEHVYTNILLSSCGIRRDQQIAEKIDGKISLIVGLRAALYSGESPQKSYPDGPYPIHLKNKEEQVILLVYTEGLSKYVGDLRVTIGYSGYALTWKGFSKFLSKDVNEDKDMLDNLQSWVKNRKN